MNLSRRQFLEAWEEPPRRWRGLGVYPLPTLAQTPLPKPQMEPGNGQHCPYCAVGCGMIVGTAHGQVVNIEEDPDHPQPGGLVQQRQRLAPGGRQPGPPVKPLYRAPGSDRWEEKEWGWTLDQIAQRIKSTRDANWIERDKDGRLVNRVEALAWLGGAALDNEECALSVKFARSLGLVPSNTRRAYDTPLQSRLCQSRLVEEQ